MELSGAVQRGEPGTAARRPFPILRHPPRPGRARAPQPAEQPPRTAPVPAGSVLRGAARGFGGKPGGKGGPPGPLCLLPAEKEGGGRAGPGDRRRRQLGKAGREPERVGCAGTGGSPRPGPPPSAPSHCDPAGGGPLSLPQVGGAVPLQLEGALLAVLLCSPPLCCWVFNGVFLSGDRDSHKPPAGSGWAGGGCCSPCSPEHPAPIFIRLFSN